MSSGDFIVYLQHNMLLTTAGIFHYQKNKGCTTAQFQISFPEPNPGTLPATFMIATMPAALQQTFFGTTYTMKQVSSVLLVIYFLNACGVASHAKQMTFVR